ncbi:ATP-binding cassette domain-containing protein [Pajaroellobacter abortibovis]|uniref:ATP-binding cassette domain-containing protein n=1 Tax=Pajaroellobacter abortibovis TaxID=1882918 RepID=UPI0009FA7D1A|nr:ATP-binding cassette domain-containing protein [Pajaroellobacter abortibovis]
MLKLENIHVKIKGESQDIHILKRIALSVDQGQFIKVIGGNGAGKSTQMNVIAGHIIPTEWEVWIDNEKVTSVPEHIRAKLVARFFRDPGVFPDLTIEENLSIASHRGKRRRLSLATSKQTREQFKAILAPL